LSDNDPDDPAPVESVLPPESLSVPGNVRTTPGGADEPLLKRAKLSVRRQT
jgi:hypothetical protein